MKARRYIQGNQYRVVKGGDHWTNKPMLTGWNPSGYGSFKPYRIELQVGEVLTYVGTKTFGGDNFPEYYFTRDSGEQGAFEPNTFGSPKDEYLEEV